jgi:hypothetical protein
VIAAGVVLNVNVAPPLLDDSAIDESLVDDTAKSDATAVVSALDASRTVMVHVIGEPTRCVPPLQASVD